MIKISALFLLLLFIAKSGNCQLTVKPSATEDHYIYVNDKLLFVARKLNLQKNKHNPNTKANIYLRKGGQLIQENENLTNIGSGSLSVFQEGTSNAFDYNYWASPVGTNISGNGLFGIGMLFSPDDKTKSTAAKITNQLNGSSNPLKISKRWIYTYTGNVYSDWHFIGSKSKIPAGYGFSMKGVNGTDYTTIYGRKNNPGGTQRYDFRGKPNSGTLTIPVSQDQTILVGNPYPSALDLSLFLIENSGTGSISTDCYGTISRNNAITGIAYFWDSKENGNSHYLQDYVGGYGAFSPVAPCTDGIYERPVFRTYGKDGTVTNQKGAHYDRRFSPIAQGFMVVGTSNTKLKFKNKHRIFKKEGENSHFKGPREEKKTKAEPIKIPKLRLEVEINGEYIRPLCLAFWAQATPGIDMAADALAFNLAPTDVGWLLNNESYVINVMPYSKTSEIPLYLKVEDSRATLKFGVESLENFNQDEIYIHDLKSEIYYPIKEHTFQIKLDPGNYHNRFKLAFRRNSEIKEPASPISEKMFIFQNNKIGQLEIRNPVLIPIISISVYDLSGKKIFEKTYNSTPKFIGLSTNHLPNSVYILKVLKKDNSVLIKKVRVFN
ncbi:MAG TPA: T9SS type A sorting domain-containing protein [Salinimicrobium sp.]|nr:T9SS type A sorting domain-containing protein [Salinimicrobium sp.]